MKEQEGTTPLAAGGSASWPRPMAANASWRFAATIVRVGVGLVSVYALTRLLGIEQFGLLALFQAAVAPLAVLDSLGRATIKYTSESLGREDEREAAEVVRTTSALNLVLGTAGALVLIAVAPWLARSLFAIPPERVEGAITGFRLIGATWLLGVTAAPYSAVLAAKQRFDLLAKLSALSVVLSAGLGVVAATLTRSVVSVVVAQSVAAAAMLVVFFSSATRLLPQAAGLPHVARPSLRRTISFWRWEIVGVAGGLATAWADRYIVGAYAGPKAVGFLALASLLSTQLYAAFIEMAEVLLPTVSHLEGRGELPAARRLALLVGWAVTIAFGACAAVLAAVGGDLLALWVSAEAAREATATLRLLCAATVLASTAVAPLFYVVALGQTRWDAAAGVLFALTLVGTGLVMVPRHGLLGVGYGLLAGALVRCGIVFLIWRIHFRVEARLATFGSFVWAPALSAVALLVGLSLLHDALAISPTWAWLIVESAVALGIAAASQLGISELLPGGAERRRDVVASFRPLVARWAGEQRGGKR